MQAEKRPRNRKDAKRAYATGVILYEMLSGALPHEDDSVGRLLRRIASEPPVPITERRGDLPQGITRTLERMLKKAPAERPGAAEAERLLAALLSPTRRHGRRGRPFV